MTLRALAAVSLVSLPADPAAARRLRINALGVDRSKVPAPRTLPPSPPEADAAEEWLRQWRERAGGTRLQALRRFVQKHRRELPHEPIPRRAD